MAISLILEKIQRDLFSKAKRFRDENTFKVNTYAEMEGILNNQSGFVKVFWNGSPEDEQRLKILNASVRCLVDSEAVGKCIVTNKATNQQAIIAKSY